MIIFGVSCLIFNPSYIQRFYSHRVHFKDAGIFVNLIKNKIHGRLIRSNRIIRIIYCMNEHLYMPITEITMKIYDPNDD